MNHFLLLSFIFLLGLLLCSFLGGYCSSKESFQSAETVSEPQSSSGPQGSSGPDTSSTPPGDITVASMTGVTNTESTQNKVYNTSTFDNYNHFTGESYPSKFYGPNGESATVVNTNGSYTLLIVDSNGVNHNYIPTSSSPPSSPPSSSSPSSSSPNSFMQNIYYGSNGGEAFIKKDDADNYIILVTQPNNSVIMYTTSTVQSQPSAMPTTNSAFPSSSPSSSIPQMPQTAQSNYQPPPPQRTPGIPPGQEDLYILKTQVVPPVCPACPSMNACPVENGKEKCPPCKPCGRCPEPSFECKKSYNYNSSGSGSNPGTGNLPMPVLNDFSTFGM
jgi:hypothetical protein